MIWLVKLIHNHITQIFTHMYAAFLAIDSFCAHFSLELNMLVETSFSLI